MPADQVAVTPYVLPTVQVQPTEQVAPVAAFVSVDYAVPAQRTPLDDAPRTDLEALAMLTSLASEFDY